MRVILILMSLLICLMPWRSPLAEGDSAVPLAITVR